MSEIWFPIKDIYFNQEQVCFILQNLEMMRLGHWPIEPKETGYTGSQKSRNQRAPFERPCEVAAEIDKRLWLCEVDGIILEAHYTLDKTVFELAKRFKTDESDISHRINVSLRFCSGWKRKTIPYKRYFSIMGITHLTKPRKCANNVK